MAGALNPRKVDPGYVKRWIREGYDLWSRASLWLILNFITMIGITFLVPNIVGLDFLVEVPATALFLIELRVLDQNGKGDFFALWSLFKGSAKDILLLTRDVFVFLFFLVMVMILVGMVVTHSAPHEPLAPSIWDQAMHIVPAWMHAMILSLVSWAGLLFNPVSMPVLFLSLLIGHQMMMNATTAFKGIFLNRAISIIFFLTSLILQSTIALISIFISHILGGMLSGIIVSAIACALLVVVVTAGYLWGREMFEGEKENAPAKQALRVLVHANQNI